MGQRKYASADGTCHQRLGEYKTKSKTEKEKNSPSNQSWGGQLLKRGPKQSRALERVRRSHPSRKTEHPAANEEIDGRKKKKVFKSIRRIPLGSAVNTEGTADIGRRK